MIYYAVLISFSILEFNTGISASMAMKTTLEQAHLGTGRKFVPTKFMEEIGQTWFMNWP